MSSTSASRHLLLYLVCALVLLLLAPYAGCNIFGGNKIPVAGVHEEPLEAPLPLPIRNGGSNKPRGEEGLDLIEQLLTE